MNQLSYKIPDGNECKCTTKNVTKARKISTRRKVYNKKGLSLFNSLSILSTKYLFFSVAIGHLFEKKILQSEKQIEFACTSITCETRLRSTLKITESANGCVDFSSGYEIKAYEGSYCLAKRWKQTEKHILVVRHLAIRSNASTEKKGQMASVCSSLVYRPVNRDGVTQILGRKRSLACMRHSYLSDITV